MYIFRSLKHRNFRIHFTGQAISLVGTWMQRIGISWLVYSMTGSALMGLGLLILPFASHIILALCSVTFVALGMMAQNLGVQYTLLMQGTAGILISLGYMYYIFRRIQNHRLAL